MASTPKNDYCHFAILDVMHSIILSTNFENQISKSSSNFKGKN